MTVQEIIDQSPCIDCTNPGQVQTIIATLLKIIAEQGGGIGGATETDAPAALRTTTTVASAMAAGEYRRELVIQNQDNVNPLKVKLGSGASAVSYHYVLAVASAAENGTGGVLRLQGYSGLVTVFSAGTPSYTYFEITS